MRKGFGRLTAMLLALVMLVSLFPTLALAAEPVVADSVYRNGNIYTVDEAFSTATALAIKGDRLIYVGDEAGVEAYIGPNTKGYRPGRQDGHSRPD